MGYCMTFQNANFFIAAGQKAAALEAARQLAATAATGSGGGAGARWFAWMNGTPFDTSWTGPFRTTINAVFADWAYPVEEDDAGNIVAITFEAEKLGDEDRFFDAIAPFVRAGSYIEMLGEDGTRWRWVFDGRTCTEEEAISTFNEKTS